MKISVSSYSFSQYMREGKLTQLSAIAAAKEIGLDAIEFTDLTPPEGTTVEEYAAEIKAEADRLGMTINAYTVGANLYQPTPEAEAEMLATIKKKVDIAAILGAKVMRHDVCWQLTPTGTGRSFDLMLPTIARCAREITEYAAQFGIRTCTENHGFIAQDSTRVERLVNAVAHDNYGLLVDIGNFVCVDEDNVRAVSRLAPYAIHAHAKDMHLSRTVIEGYGKTRGCNYFKGAILGEGDVDVVRCIEVLKKAGYDGYISIEFEGKEDCIYAIGRGKEFLEAII
jgi:sugar phosphate isomerase/epimerase